MPKGDSAVTDFELLSRLDRLIRPITVRNLAIKLEWSRGKVDGALNRVTDQIAIVKVTSPKGQARRYVGLPNQPYWRGFVGNIEEQENIIVNDPRGVCRDYFQSSEPLDDSRLSDYQKSVTNLTTQLKDREAYITNLEKHLAEIQAKYLAVPVTDPQVLDIINQNMPEINQAAAQRNISPAEILEAGIRYFVNPSFESLVKMVAVVIDDSKKGTDSFEGMAARSIMKRAGIDVKEGE